MPSNRTTPPADEAPAADGAPDEQAPLEEPPPFVEAPPNPDPQTTATPETGDPTDGTPAAPHTHDWKPIVALDGTPMHGFHTHRCTHCGAQRRQT